MAAAGKKKSATKKSAVRTSAAAKKSSVTKSIRKSANPLGLEKKAPGQFDTLQEIALAAYRKLPSPVWDHLMGGADSEMTLRRNRAGLDALALRQRPVRPPLQNLLRSPDTGLTTVAARWPAKMLRPPSN